jgi:hypothetical protein
MARYKLFFGNRTAAGAIEVTADAGSYAITGTNANLEYGRLVAADIGSYTVTGVNASLPPARTRTPALTQALSTTDR